MANVRVYQLAKELGLTSAQLKEALQGLGVETKTASSSIDETTAQAVRELFSQERDSGAVTIQEELPTELVGEPIKVTPPVTIRDFAALLDTDVDNVIAELRRMGENATAGNQIFAPEVFVRLGTNWGYQLLVEAPSPEAEPASAAAKSVPAAVPGPEIEPELAPPPPLPAQPPTEARPEGELPPGLPEITAVKRWKPSLTESAQPRPPVVTVLGHVDHGKTTLLDAIRHTQVTAQEPGEITQHIGAYQVEVGGRQLTFIDTPGHEAFTALRARGAMVTDIAVLVVAADDGVMPQTIEAIDHARAAEVPIIVAINKIDRPEANVERIKRQLADLGLMPEEWGGETVCLPISATQETGVEHLLEMILLVAEMADLRADPKKPAVGTVIEAKLDRRRGPAATVLVQEGTLRVGDGVLVGACAGKVRAMNDDRGRPLKEALPSLAVEIMGLSEVPQAGELLRVVASEKVARELASEQRELQRGESRIAARPVSLQDFFQQLLAGEVKDLNLILKTDTYGSTEAIVRSLGQLRHKELSLNILHFGVGDVSESDVMLASASQAIIIGFQVAVEPQARRIAREEGIDVRIYQVIYDLIDDVKAAMVGLLQVIYQEVVTGRAEVRALFRSSRAGTIAGCYVSEGRMVRGGNIRVRRNGDVVFEGSLSSLRHLKEDVREIGEGFECGIAVENFNDFQVGDIIEFITQQEVRRETL